jgi:D-xylose transport system substrate-binding protein
MFKKTVSLVLVVMMCLVAFAACTPAAEEPAMEAAEEAVEEVAEVVEANEEVIVGVAMGDLRLERWARDLGYMEDAANAAGITVLSQSADGDEQRQMQQIEAMLTQGASVIICMPVQSKTMSQAVDAVHEAGAVIIAYDRIIENADLDYYITFDMRGVGRLQAEAILAEVPTGNYYLLGGQKGDNNGDLFQEGQKQIWEAYADRGDITIVAEQWAEGWLEENAFTVTENALVATDEAGTPIDAIIATNDSTAAGAIGALKDVGLAGKIPVSGQDANLDACQRIVEGTQTMTVYKPLIKLATATMEAAIKLAKGEMIETTGTYPNGEKDVPSIDLEIYSVNIGNMMDTVIADGFHSYEDVYKNVPEDERPPQS